MPKSNLIDIDQILENIATRKTELVPRVVVEAWLRRLAEVIRRQKDLIARLQEKIEGDPS